jgi:hypothetical protein
LQEAEKGRIDLSEEDPKILSRILIFLYTGDYDAAKVPDFFHKLTAKSAKATSNKVKAMGTRTSDGKRAMADLKTHAMVYKLADMLDITALKTTASDRFLAGIGNCCDSPSFAEPLKVMYEHTQPCDAFLRLPATTACVKQHKKVTWCPEVLEVIMRYEANAWKVGLSIMRTCEEKHGNSVKNDYRNASGW